MNIGHVGHDLCPSCEDDRVELERLREQVKHYHSIWRKTEAEVEAAYDDYVDANAEIERLRAAFQLDDEHDCSPAEHPLCFEVERLRGTLKAADIVKERLREEVERLQGLLTDRTQEWKQALHDRDEYRHEVERLRAEGQRKENAWLAEEKWWFQERDKLNGEVERMQAWGQQVHDALDGKPLPELPDEAPARIERLREELEGAHNDYVDVMFEVERLRKNVHNYAAEASKAGSEVEQLRAEKKESKRFATLAERDQLKRESEWLLEANKRLADHVNRLTKELKELREGGENAENSRGRTRVHVPSETGEREVQPRPQDYTGLSDDYPA